MQFQEAVFSPIKWLQVDVVSGENSSSFEGSFMNSSSNNINSNNSKCDFRVSLSSIKPIPCDDQLRSLIPDVYFEAIKSGQLFEVQSDGFCYATPLFRGLGEAFMIRKSQIMRYAPNSESLALLRAAYPQIMDFQSQLMEKLRIKLLEIREFTFPDPNTGKFLSCLEKNELEPKIILDEECIKSSILYDELVHLLWSLGNFFVQIASE